MARDFRSEAASELGLSARAVGEMPTRALVTGASGFIGTALVRRLKHDGGIRARDGTLAARHAGR